NLRTSTEYDAAGRVISRTDQSGRKTVYQYDALGRLTETIYPDATPATLADNPRTKTEYNAAGRVTAQTDEDGNRTEFTYDHAGRPPEVRDALGDKPLTHYDAAGRPGSFHSLNELIPIRGKVVVARAARERMAAAKFGSPCKRNRAMALLRSPAITSGALSLRTWLRSSPSVSSRTQCNRF